MNRNLAHWSESLGAFDDILDTRQRAYQQRRPNVADEGFQSGFKPQTLMGVCVGILLLETRGDGRQFSLDSFDFIAAAQPAQPSFRRIPPC